MKTLLLNPSNWDLQIDAAANIAVANNPYALAQDAASAIKLFLGECYYDTTKGVPYWDQVLGLAPPLSYMKALFVNAALTVPEVVAARAFIDSFIDREIKGQVQVTQDGDVFAVATF